MKTVLDIVMRFKELEKAALVNKTGYRTFTTTYAQLFEKVAKTASLLERLRIKKGDKLIIWGYNCPEWATVFLAAATKGIIVVPIDHMALPEHVKRIQDIVSAKLVVHSEYKLPRGTQMHEIILEHLDKLIENLPQAHHEVSDIDENDTLEIVFTSGTTGNPKGVILSHKNIMSNIAAIKKCVKVTSDQIFLSLLPLSHLLEQTPGLLAPLSALCTIVYVKGLRPSLIFKALAEEKVTNIVAVPRLLKLFADEIMREAEEKKISWLFKKLAQLKLPAGIKKKLFWPVHRKFGKNFRYFIIGGAPFSPELEQFWDSLGFTVVQGYGLTECAPVLTCNTPLGRKPVSVGQALPGVELMFGKDGEICARGENISQGYYGDKAKTNEAFAGGWFKTGDMGFADKEGYVFLKGRKKDMIVTSGGENVYPEDIEEILLEDRNVKDACVVGVPTRQGEQVHAELILKNKANLRQIIEKSNKLLNPAQQIMSYSVWHASDFPRTTTLKIKKHLVLEAVLNRKKPRGAALQQPQSRLHELLSRIEGISKAAIKPEAKLGIDLKLTSVNRVELVSMIEQEFNLDVNEEEITGETTVSQLESLIEKREKIVKRRIFRAWLLWPPVRAIRIAYNLAITDNFMRIFCWRKITGAENLKGLKEPAIFIANHVGYFDAPNVLMSLPLPIRSKMAVAAWQEYFDIPKNKILKKILYQFYYEYASIFVNIFPFQKQKGFKRNIEYAGELLDKGWNILFFPEGEHSKTGKLQPFKAGIGWLAKEMRCPIVPIKHHGLEKIMAGDEHQLPKFGRVAIKIGKPVKLDYTKSIPALTSEIQEIIEKM
ncbi:AMP-binding protein [Candidatus Woesearchaeota archaeon]|nr:AMP-binding protein [Candidatus Woesearchaeota archaeon]